MRFQFKSPVPYIAALLIALLSFSFAAAQSAQVNTIDGWFSVVFGDPEPGSDVIPGNRYGLTTEDGQQFSLDIAPSVLQAAGGFGKLNGTFVRVSVPAQTDRAVLTNGGTLSVQSLDVAPLPLRVPQMSQRDPVSGAQPWVTILCAFPGTPEGYGTESTPYFQGMYSANFPGMDHYWRQQSFGKVTLAGSQTYGWFTLDNAQSTYFPTPGFGSTSYATLVALAQNCVNKADPTVDFSPYKGINIMFNGELDCCAWGGGALLQTDGSAKGWRVTWNPPWSWQDITVVSHEIGHGFGLPHANNYDNDGDPYDNTWDVMSETYQFCYKATHVDYGCLGQHTNAYYKDWLGWFDPSERLEVTYDRSNITLDHLAHQNPDDYQIVTIPIPGTSKYYVVEARQTDDSNYDAKLAGKAVIIHEVDETRQEWAWLVGGTSDAKSMSVENNQANPDGAWLVGETYTDAGKGISISVVSETSDGFVISVDMPGVAPTPTFTPLPPTATWTPGGPTATPTLETPNPSTNLIANGGMEAATDNGDLPDAWAFKNLTSDKLKCNKPEKQVAYAGNCAFMFKGGPGEASKLSQSYTPSGPLSGTIITELYTQGSNAAVSGKFTIKIEYTNGGKGKLNIEISPSSSYIKRPGSLPGAGNISGLKFMLKNNSAAGKFYVDNVLVKVE